MTTNPIIRHKTFLKEDSLLYLIFFTTALLYALLIVKVKIPFETLVFVLILCVLHWFLTKREKPSSPVLLPIIGLVILLPFSYILSINKELTIIKLNGFVLSLFLFYFLSSFLNNISRLKIVILALLLMTFFVTLFGFLATDWSGSSYLIPKMILNQAQQYFPSLLQVFSSGRIHVNTLGGTLAFFVPFLASLLVDKRSIQRTFFYPSQRSKFLNTAIKIIVFVLLTFVIFVLVLTQSRASYLGSIIGLLVMLIWKKPFLYWLIPLFFVLLLSAFLVLGNGNLLEFTSKLDTSQGGDTVQVRLEYWERTLSLVQDFPFTGAGLGVYNNVFDDLYVFNPIPHSEEISFYAHNMYLAIAASMGIPALVLFITIFSCIFWMIYKVFSAMREIGKTLITGLSCGLIANLIYGFWDNYMLGEKLAVVLWIFLGIITAFYIHRDEYSHHPGKRLAEGSQKYENKTSIVGISPSALLILVAAALWIGISLAAISFLIQLKLICLISVLLGSIYLGFVLVWIYETYILTQPESTLLKDH